MSVTRAGWLLLLTACGVGDSYICTRDSQCVHAGDQGWCEASGYCAFADASCGGGRRYGRWAPAPYGSACVTAGDMAMSSDLRPSNLAPLAGCGDDLQPCCSGATCNGGLTCGNGTCFFFFDGFDGTIAPSWTATEENGSSVTADPARSFRGAGSLRITANTGSVGWELVNLSRPSSQSPLYARAFFWIPSTALLSTTDAVQLMGYSDSNDAPYPAAALELDSAFRVGVAVTNWSSTPASALAPTAIPRDAWVCLEWSVRWDAGAGVSASAMGAPVASLAPSPLPNPLDISFIGFAGPPPLSPLTFWIDELALDQHPIGCTR